MPPSQKDWPLYAIAQQLNFASKHRVRFAANVDVAKWGNMVEAYSSYIHGGGSRCSLLIRPSMQESQPPASGAGSPVTKQTSAQHVRDLIPSPSVQFFVRSLQSTNIDSSSCLFLPRRSVNVLLFLPSTWSAFTTLSGSPASAAKSKRQPPEWERVNRHCRRVNRRRKRRGI